MLSHLLVSDDGLRLKLGPAALAHAAFTDGARPGTDDAHYAGAIVSEAPIPATHGPITTALAGVADARAPADNRRDIRRDTLDEGELPPELLADALLGASAENSPKNSPKNSPSGVDGATGAPRVACGSADVWQFGRLVFELHYGAPLYSFTTQSF